MGVRSSKVGADAALTAEESWKVEQRKQEIARVAHEAAALEQRKVEHEEAGRHLHKRISDVAVRQEELAVRESRLRRERAASERRARLVDEVVKIALKQHETRTPRSWRRQWANPQGLGANLALAIAT